MDENLLCIGKAGGFVTPWVKAKEPSVQSVPCFCHARIGGAGMDERGPFKWSNVLWTRLDCKEYLPFQFPFAILLKENKVKVPALTFVDISLEDWTKLRDLLRNLSSPLDNLLFPPSDLRVRFKIEEFMNRRRG